MTVRERLEAQEDALLSPLAARSADAKRSHPMEECPFRTKFQRDRDRILHSKSFRRLKHKTQVYIVAGDHYRTRMTHTLEVSQISRTIARGLRLNEDLTEAIALDGILNHTGKGMPSTFEGRIVRIADRIAYLCHDYDDSLRAGLLAPEELPREVRDTFGIDTSAMITRMVSDMIVTSEERGDAAFSEETQHVMDLFRSFMFERIYHSKTLAHERAQAGFVLRALMDHFTVYFDKLPPEFIARAERWGREQCVVDYVAGLTDSYAVALFREIYIPPVDQMTIKPI